MSEGFDRETLDEKRKTSAIRDLRVIDTNLIQISFKYQRPNVSNMAKKSPY
jgi:hypothetical protein